MGTVTPPRTVFCSADHARRYRNQDARAAGRFARWLKRRRRNREQLAVSEQRWRDVAMGRDADRQIALIFEEKGKRR